jgi:hypothetical protein
MELIRIVEEILEANMRVLEIIESRIRGEEMLGNDSKC